MFSCSDGQLIFPWDFLQLGEVMPELNFQSNPWLALCSHFKMGTFAFCFQDREKLCLALVFLNGSCEPWLSWETEILSRVKQKILWNIQTLLRQVCMAWYNIRDKTYNLHAAIFLPLYKKGGDFSWIGPDGRFKDCPAEFTASVSL